MRFDRLPVRLLVFVMVSLCLIIGGCRRPYSLKSAQLDKNIAIDGNDRDWKGNRRYYDEKSNTRISICNDNDNLYIRLVAMDPGVQMSIQRHGLSIWLCETGKGEKVWGLRYPATAQGMKGEDDSGGFDRPGGPGKPWGGEYDNQNQKDGTTGENRGEQGRTERPSDMPGPPDMPSYGDDEHNDLNMPINDSFLIYNSEKGPGSILTPDEMSEFGILCKFSPKMGSGMVYEIKIPLDRSEKTPYAARLSADPIVSIGFVTEKVTGGNRPDKDGPERGSGGGGPGGPGGGGMGGGPPGGGGMGGGKRVESIEIWANIELASNPALSR